MSETTESHHPGWGWSIASASLVVGLVAFFFPLAPFWTLLWLAALTVLFGLTPLGERWVITQRSALLSDVVAHPSVSNHPRLVAAAVFIVPAVLVPGVAWDLSDPGQRWNGGALWGIAVFGFLVRSMVEELRSAGHRARWWFVWLALAIVLGGLMLVGAPGRIRWAYCESRMNDGGTLCWGDAARRVVGGDQRYYFDIDDSPGALPDAGEGLVYSPTRAIETAGVVRVLVPLGDGWYWFETGSPVRDFWFDG